MFEAEHPGCVGQLGCPDIAQVAKLVEVVGAGPQGRGLTPGEAQAVDSGTGVDECAEDRPEPESLVVGMGEHDPGSGRRSSGSGWPVIGQPRAQEAPRARSPPGPAVPSSGWKSPVRASWW